MYKHRTFEAELINRAEALKRESSELVQQLKRARQALSQTLHKSLGLQEICNNSR